MTNDMPIHLGTKHKEVPVGIFQDHLDGLCALIHYCEGIAAAGGGEVPGKFELVMHYRSLRSAINKVNE